MNDPTHTVTKLLEEVEECLDYLRDVHINSGSITGTVLEKARSCVSNRLSIVRGLGLKTNHAYILGLSVTDGRFLRKRKIRLEFSTTRASFVHVILSLPFSYRVYLDRVLVRDGKLIPHLMFITYDETVRELYTSYEVLSRFADSIINKEVDFQKSNLRKFVTYIKERARDNIEDILGALDFLKTEDDFIELLAGLLDGDGVVTKSRHVAIAVAPLTRNNRPNMKGLVVLILVSLIESLLNIEFTNYVPSDRKLYISTRSLKRLNQRLIDKIVHPEKRERLSRIIRHN